MASFFQNVQIRTTLRFNFTGNLFRVLLGGIINRGMIQCSRVQIDIIAALDVEQFFIGLKSIPGASKTLQSILWCGL